MRDTGLHVRVGSDPRVLDLDPDFLEFQMGDVGYSAKCKKKILAVNANDLAVVLEGNFLLASDAPGIE